MASNKKIGIETSRAYRLDYHKLKIKNPFYETMIIHGYITPQHIFEACILAEAGWRLTNITTEVKDDVMHILSFIR